MSLSMNERCAKCGEGCEDDSDRWKRCSELSDEEWLQLLAGGMLLSDVLEDVLPFEC
ncbi:MAG: hypothetical protein ACE5QF_04250 [Thermoplasmata archaeon]